LANVELDREGSPLIDNALKKDITVFLSAYHGHDNMFAQHTEQKLFQKLQQHLAELRQ
jgi:hypothetical protein